MQPSNCLNLLGEARGKTVKEIDDLLARHFPKPDVPEVLRALPLRAPASASPALVEPPKKSSAAERTIPMFDDQILGSSSDNASATSTLSALSALSATLVAPASAAFSATDLVPSTSASLDAPRCDLFGLAAESSVKEEPTQSRQPSQPTSSTGQAAEAKQSASSQPTRSTGTQSRRKERLTPLSEGRHALQLTVSTEIREKLERARDLMSHRNRDGSFETIVGAALDALLVKLERERLGKTTRATVTHASSLETPPSTAASAATATATSTATTTATATATTSEALPSASESSNPALETMTNDASTTSDNSPSKSIDLSNEQRPHASPNDAADQRAQRPTHRAISKTATKSARADSKQLMTRPRSKALPRAVRREVFARDGEQCSFVSEAGVRCDARSFLEIDHIHPKALGGEDSAVNTRLLCATHNRLAAERVFGRDYVKRKIRDARAIRRQRPAQRDRRKETE